MDTDLMNPTPENPTAVAKVKKPGSGYPGRKFWLAAGSQIANVGLCAFGMIDGTLFVTATAIVVGGYYTGNVTQKAVAKPDGA